MFFRKAAVVTAFSFAAAAWPFAPSPAHAEDAQAASFSTGSADMGAALPAEPATASSTGAEPAVPEGSWGAAAEFPTPPPDAVPAASGADMPPPAPAPARAQFAFQVPTYLLEKADSELGAYSCDPAKPECKVNLDLSPTFSGVSASAWGCLLDFGMAEPTGEEGKCNPNTVTLTGVTVNVRLRAWKKSDPAAVWEREFSVAVRPPPEASVETGASAPAASEGTGADSGTGAADGDAGDPFGSGTEAAVSGSAPEADGAGADAGSGTAGGSGSDAADAVTGQPATWPDPAVVVQSGLDGQGRCLKADCAANFASSLSGSAYSCSWDLGGGTFSSASSSGSCNPSYAHFPTGAIYRVALEVRNKSGARKSASLDVINPFAAPATVTVVERTSVVSASAEPPKFPPTARIALQGRLSANRWADGKAAGCVAETASGCSFNFDGRSSSAADLVAASFAWDYGFGTGASGPNPPAVRFAPGTWTVRLRVSDAYGSSADEWRVEVLREKPAAVPVNPPSGTRTRKPARRPYAACLRTGRERAWCRRRRQPRSRAFPPRCPPPFPPKGRPRRFLSRRRRFPSGSARRARGAPGAPFRAARTFASRRNRRAP